MIEKVKTYYKNHGLIKTIKWTMSRLNNKIRLKINAYKTVNSKEGNDKNKIKIRTKERVFIFASVPYFDIGGGQRSAQLAKVFKEKNFDVFYIYGLKTNESKIHKMDYPTVMHKYINKVSIKQIKKLINKDDIVIFEMPDKKFIPYLNLAYEQKAKIIYESIDNWETSLGETFFNKNILKQFLKQSDLLTATALPLKEQLENYLKEFKIENKRVIYSSNAVNSNIFNPNIKYEIPKDLIKGEKTFLYYGSLWGSWFNWEIVKDLAKTNKNYQINLIGDDNNLFELKKTLPDNIHFLGLKKQTELPNYLSHIDYAILPFKKDKIGNFVSPLKIFEYISMNKIVLTTSLPEVLNYPNTYLGDNIEKWKEIIDKNFKVNIKEKETFIKKNNWEYRVNEILNIIREIKNEKNN